MNLSQKNHVRLQYLTGRIAVVFLAPVVYLILWLAGYRVRDLDKIRKKISRLYRDHPGPWLICANHLTLVDSIIITWVMAPFYLYMIRYSRVPWNMPEKTNFNKNIVMTILTFVLKCIPVIRGGDRSKVADSLAKCEFLLEKNESLVIFPEGTRSRTGRISSHDFSYGVGRLFLQIPDCRVLCLYIRGEKQDMYSDFPAKNQNFYVDVRPFIPSVTGKGLRAQRDCASQIIQTLIHMEKRYASRYRKRHR